MSRTQPAGSSDVLELPKVEPKHGDSDKDRFAHVVRRDRADRSMITVEAVVALCGKVWVPTRDASKFPLCPKCKVLREHAQNPGRGFPFSS